MKLGLSDRSNPTLPVQCSMPLMTMIMSTRTVSASQFKAGVWRCSTRWRAPAKEIVITMRGRAVARVSGANAPDSMRDSGTFMCPTMSSSYSTWSGTPPARDRPRYARLAVVAYRYGAPFGRCAGSDRSGAERRSVDLERLGTRNALRTGAHLARSRHRPVVSRAFAQARLEALAPSAEIAVAAGLLDSRSFP